MKVVNSHLRVLVAEKSLREKRPIGILTIVKETQASRSTVQRLLNNTIKNVPLEELAKLCVYLNCGPGDILRLENDPYITPTE
jgi:DNA-binding Xre family transcriptional regulator